MADPASTGGRMLPAGSEPMEYKTVFVRTDPVPASLILPYVLEALGTIGYGSAVTVGEKGIQLTLPIQLTQFLQSTIEQYTAVDAGGKPTFDLAPLDTRVLYPPVLKVRGPRTSCKPLIDSLGLCPPDMKVEWVALGESEGALVVSGPKARLDYYRAEVFPSLKQVANSLGPSAELTR